MKRILISILILSTVPVFALSQTKPANQQKTTSALDGIVPKPMSTELLKGTFRVSGAAVKCDPSIDSLSLDAIMRLAGRIGLVSGRTCPVSTPIGLADAISKGSAKGIFFLRDKSLGNEEYSITVSPKAAVIKASSLNGFIYSIQTIKQMLPESIYGNVPAENGKWVLPCCVIKDRPLFAYRGMHLDSARHFWSVEEVKKYLDVMAMYKLNRFHWHLTDDQGWRIEIKAYPLLSQIASYREGTMTGKDFNSDDHKLYGGFYTQDQIRDIVRYAGRLGITVIPEIDLPGHMLAAMSAYPWLGCTGGPYSSWTKWGVSDQVLCAGKESTYKFLETVLGEVTGLFPSEYIHIGGDECPKTEWKKCPACQAKIAELCLKSDDKYSAEQYLQNYVTARIQKFLESRGKKIIGWDEILEGRLEPGATVMSWRGTDGAKEAIARGFDAIMTPNSHLYFDYCQSENQDEEPLSNGGFISLEKVYSFNPYEGITEEMRSHIIGVQANLWTEYIPTNEQLEYMLLPRMLALSEVQWCRPEARDFDRFMNSMKTRQSQILEKAGYNYRKKY